MIIVCINIVINFRGLGFWKFNMYFLIESEYINLIRKIIIDVLKEYEG